MGLNYEQRAKDNFSVARAEIAREIKPLVTRHPAHVSFRSGNTAKEAVSIFAEQTAEAVSKSLNEMANQIEHRGAKWRHATKAIASALDDHLSQARMLLATPLAISGATGETAAAKAVDALLAGAAERLRSQVSEFQEGWTAPRPKHFKDRHPTWDRLIFIAIGAIVTLALQALMGAWPSQ